MRTSFLSFLLLCVGLHSLHAETPPQTAVEHKHATSESHPAPVVKPYSGISAIDVVADEERLHLLTVRVSADTDNLVLEYHYSEDGGRIWSIPVVVNTKMPKIQGARRGMDPQLIVTPKFLLATWMTEGTGFFNSGPMVAAQSIDQGKTWTRVADPSKLTTTDGRGFADLSVDPEGNINMVWLENLEGNRGLMFAKTPDGGNTWTGHTRLDDKTCECCWNTIVQGPAGETAVLYRAADLRDMKLIVSMDQGKTWQPSEYAGRASWVFKGCPHVGGGLTFHSGPDQKPALSVIQWTGEKDLHGMYYTRKSLIEKGWSSPVRLGGVTATHPDIASDGDKHLVVTWDQQTHQSTTIFASESLDGGETFSQLKRVSNIRSSAYHPKVLYHRGQFHFLWTEVADHGRTVWKHRAGL